tara:strand:+ start:308 stop:919 length:612 start_codon:yes stop_codon:yes gene_type:complete
MINNKHKFIFIHIPKCGGTSIENSFRKIAANKPNGYDGKVGGFLQHLTCSEILHHNFLTKQDFDKHYKFAFVRNPFSRCVSEYTWRIKKYGNWSNNFQVSFKDFVKRNYRWQERSFEQHMKPQIEFTHDADMNLMVDYVGRFENLQQDFDNICDKIGIPQQRLPHDNKSNDKYYTEYYDDETRQIVAEKYAQDIDNFGYKFDR